MCTDEKSENGRAENSISAIKDKLEHLDHEHLTVQDFAGICVSGLNQPFASFPHQFGVLPRYF